MKSKMRFFQSAGAALLVLLLAVLFSGCGEHDRRLGRLIITSGADQLLLPGEKADPVIVQAVDRDGEVLAGLTIEISQAANSDLVLPDARLVTDAGGRVRLNGITTGKRTGDNLLLLTPKGHPDQAVAVRLINGVKLLSPPIEGRAGKALDEPVRLRITDGSGSGIADAELTLSGSAGLEFSPAHPATNADGVAELMLTLPDATGTAQLQLELPDGALDNMVRSIVIPVRSVNYLTLVVQILGGVAFFLFGMKLLSEGLTKLAGERLKGLLRFCAKNHLVALLTGTFVTAVIQSSCATTVMTIGFVNAGLLTLAQSIGIIFGANIGTTVTAQLISFSIGSVALPAIIIGVLMLFFAGDRLRGLGNAVLGFGLLFFGMNLMSSELKTISEFPSLIAVFRTFDCAPVGRVMPIGAVAGAIGIGLVATMVMQSSSAVSGIVIAMGAGGMINLYTGAALILGSHVGTTVTAQLAAISCNKPAKQTALAHTLFNVFGLLLITAMFYIPWGSTGIPSFFYLVNLLSGGDGLTDAAPNLPRHIANAHTLSSVITAIVLFPAIDLLAALCRRLIPQGEGKVHFKFLEPLLLDTPLLALDQTLAVFIRMLKKSWKMIDQSINDCFIPLDIDSKKNEKLRKREQNVDRYQEEIMEYLAQAMHRAMSERQSDRVPPLMHCTNDAERIADRAENIVHLAERMRDAGRKLSDEGVQELRDIYRELENQADLTVSMLENRSRADIDAVLALERKINRLAETFEDAHIQRVKNDRCAADTGIIYVELLAEITAISRHLSNVAERIPLICNLN